MVCSDVVVKKLKGGRLEIEVESLIIDYIECIGYTMSIIVYNVEHIAILCLNRMHNERKLNVLK